MTGGAALMVSLMATQTQKLAVISIGSRIRCRNISNLGVLNKTVLKSFNPGHSKSFSSSTQESSFVQLIRQQQVLKESDAECRRVLCSPGCRFLPYYKGQPLVLEGSYQPVLLSREEVEPYLAAGRSVEECAVWLKAETGDDGGGLAVTFGVTVENDDVAAQVQGRKFINLRMAMLFIGSAAPMLSQGSSLLRWHKNTKYCANCGSANVEKSVSGNRISCPDCQAIYYPPTSPVGISLVSSPDHSQVLLQRNPKYPKGMYSCIAGFVDVGETLFDCLKREVAEEGGVELLADSTCQILNSQHWPFPAGSLMMGCLVYADPHNGTVPSIDHLSGEIEDVAWFHASDVRDALAFIDSNPKMRLEGSTDAKLFVPPKGTIANQMLTTWIQKFHN